jgi:hypothetical protein
LVSSAFATGAELGTLFSKSPIISPAFAQLASGGALYLVTVFGGPGAGSLDQRSPLGALHVKVWPSLAMAFMATANNQVGQAYRRFIEDKNETIVELARRVQFPEATLAHTNDALKTMGALAAMDLIAATGQNLGASFTSAYLLREGLIQHFNHTGKSLAAALTTGSILSAAGALGTYKYAQGANSVLAAGLLEAGAYSFLDGGVNYLLLRIPADSKVVASYACQFGAAAIGALIYVPNANTVSGRIRTTVAGALFFNAAYASVELAKYLASQLTWQN